MITTNIANLKNEIQQLKRSTGLEIIGLENSLLPIYMTIKKIKDIEINVLITGETGTGKNLIARLIHNTSIRKEKNFVTINCATIPVSLIESELFGYDKGTFTGASSKGKVGLIEAADEGTLFIDEIGDMPREVQLKLLNVLEEKSFRRVGSTKSQTVNFRLITATHRPLREMIKEGDFRQDLYGRISTFVLHLPPIRERQEDLHQMADHLLSRWCEKAGCGQKQLSPEALKAIKFHPWELNIRGLDKAMARAMINSGDRKEINITDVFPDEEEGAPDLERAFDQITAAVLNRELPFKAVTKKLYLKLINEAGGVREASEITGLKKDRFYRAKRNE